MRLVWCKKWLKRALELDKAEKDDAASRHSSAAQKRLRLTAEILADVQYEDPGALDIMRDGSTIAGEIPSRPVFQPSYKPCLATLSQLEASAQSRNQLVMSLTASLGDEELDEAVVAETQEEVNRGWAHGPWELDQLEWGATISRRFAIRQSEKIRMMEDYSVSGINDSATVNAKLDLHAIDTFVAVVKQYFESTSTCDQDSSLMAKTYDLKSACRQIPIRSDRLKFAYFCVYNRRVNRVQIFRSRTLPFGSTHSVYSFLRLARMLHAIATRCLSLVCANFYDDFILASSPQLTQSASRSMEMLFLLTGWDYARDGKKHTEFSAVCKALGVAFNLELSSERILSVSDTESRVCDLTIQIDHVLETRTLSRPDALKLRGRLGFADSFLHGRLGALLLKRLVDHA